MAHNTPNSEAPASFLEWTLHNANEMVPGPNISAQTGLHQDITDYAAYLKCIPENSTTHLHAIWHAAHNFYHNCLRMLCAEVRTFDFTPASASGHRPF